MSKLVKARVASNGETGPGIFHLVMETPEIAGLAEPGQFVNIRISQATAPLLRRPISVHWVEGDKLEILYQVVGQGTKLLTQVRAGETLDIQGPLGRGFKSDHRGRALLVGGGIGIAPLGLLAKELLARGSEVICLLGARDAATLLAAGGSRLQEMGLQVITATDDGSMGKHGFVTELIAEILRNTVKVDTRIYACGPKLMLREVSRLATEYSLPCEISLEEHMGCGVGACLGCVCKGVPKFGKENLRRVCTDGPVFESREVVWE